MDVGKVKRGDIPAYGPPAASGSGGKGAGSFQRQLGGRLREEYRSRTAALFDELGREAGDILERADIVKFEKYRALIGRLLDEIMKNAYELHAEHILDGSGRQRVYATVRVIDEKLDDMAKDLLNRNGERLSYLSRVDEIRGLVMDLLS